MEKVKSNRKRILGLVGICAAVGLGFLSVYKWRHVSTDNAQIQAHTLMLSSKVSGIVMEVLVQENEKVKEGQVLARIDSKDYNNSVVQISAELESARVKLKDAESNYHRMDELIKSNVISRQQFETAQATYRELSKRVAAISAQVDQAKLNASYTEIKAPSDGKIARKSVEPGMVIPMGQPLFGFVDSSLRWVTANFKETEISHIFAGNPAILEVDALPGKEFEGQVESMSPSTGAIFSLLPPDNSTGNFTKVVQRIPVRIKLLNLSSEDIDRLQAGLSASVTVKIR